jgi:hypothetical protein
MDEVMKVARNRSASFFQLACMGLVPRASGAKLSVVMRGLDPRIHYDSPIGQPYGKKSWHSRMDGRVKPGHDGVEGQPQRIPLQQAPALGGA